MMFLNSVLIILVNFLHLEAHKMHHNMHAHQSGRTDQQQKDGTLFLTPYIERGDIEEAQRAATVSSFNNDNIISYSGFLTVNKQYNSNMFFWYYPNEKQLDDAPLILWLSGGPGASSVGGLFELGPYYVDKNITLHKRHTYLSQIFNVLFIDNPVGTGYSFTDDPKGYSKDQSEIADNLYICMEQFYKLFPKLKKNDFYISGSSYAGKYTTAFAYKIDENQKNQNDNKNKINLRGIIVGNGFFDPAITIRRSPTLFENGLFDFNDTIEFGTMENNIVKLINEKKFGEALDLNNEMRELLAKKTAYTSLLDLPHNTDQYPYGQLNNYLERIKNNIHVGNIPFRTADNVVPALRFELMKSVKPWFEHIAEKYRILLYSGHLDMEIPYVACERFLLALKWSGADEYLKAERKLWYVDNVFAGYKKTVGKLTEVFVRNAGHNAHIDQPKFVYILFDTFISKN